MSNIENELIDNNDNENGVNSDSEEKSDNENNINNNCYNENDEKNDNENKHSRKSSSVEEKKGFKGYIMRADTMVARIENDRLSPLISTSGDTILKMPIYIQRTLNLYGWLKMRAAEKGREQIIEMRRHYGFNGGDQIGTVMAMHAVSNDDDFWIKPDNENLTYDDVSFKSDTFFKHAIEGTFGLKKLHRDPTPEFTTRGKSDKGWFLEEGEWFISKVESDYAVFSELFSSALAVLLRIKAVPYFIKDRYITSKNFVPKGRAYEPIYSVVGDEEDVQLISEVMSDFGLMKPYLDMLFVDALVNNVERHNFKYGFITNAENLETEMSPYFGCDSGMFATGISAKTVRKRDDSINRFITAYKFIKNKMGYMYSCPKVKKQFILGAYQWTQSVLPIPAIKLEDVVEICGRGYSIILNEIN